MNTVTDGDVSREREPTAGFAPHSLEAAPTTATGDNHGC